MLSTESLDGAAVTAAYLIILSSRRKISFLAFCYNPLVNYLIAFIVMAILGMEDQHRTKKKNYVTFLCFHLQMIRFASNHLTPCVRSLANRLHKLKRVGQKSVQFVRIRFHCPTSLVSRAVKTGKSA